MGEPEDNEPAPARTTLPIPEVNGEMPASTSREAARVLGPLASEVRLEATASGFRFVGVDPQGEEVGDLSLTAEALASYQLRRAGACILDVARLEDSSRVPRRKQLVRFDVGGDPAVFRFTVGFLTRTMFVSRTEGPHAAGGIANSDAAGLCKLCGGTRILDTRRHSYPCPWCSSRSQSAA